ncbi:MAG: alkaline phosphatase, partial [Rhodothalassiaceae bacterium]
MSSGTTSQAGMAAGTVQGFSGTFLADSVVQPSNALDLQLIGRFESGVFDEGAVEIAAFDPASQQLFVTNGNDDTLDIYDL